MMFFQENKKNVLGSAPARSIILLYGDAFSDPIDFRHEV